MNKEDKWIVREDIILRDESKYINSNIYIVKDNIYGRPFYVTREGFEILKYLAFPRKIDEIKEFYKNFLKSSFLNKEESEKISKFINKFIENNIIVKTNEGKAHKKILSNLSLPLVKDVNYIPMSFPMEVMILLTERCNLSCRHCIISSSPTKSRKDELSTEELKRILLELDKGGLLNLILSGGEPLIRNDIWEILLFASRLRFSLSLLTNGILLSLPQIEVLSEIAKRKGRGFWVNISLDGSTPESHARLRGKERIFNRTLQNLKLLVKNNIQCSTETILHQKNKDEIESIIKICFELGVKIVTLHPASLSRKRVKEKDLYMTLDEIMEIGYKIEKLKEKYSNYGKINFDLYHYFFTQPSVRMKKEQEEQKDNSIKRIKLPQNCCSAGMYSMVISAKGKVYPCDEVYGLQMFEMGDVRKSILIEIWHNEKWNIFRGGWKREDVKVCNKCMYNESCSIIKCRCYPYSIFRDFYAPLPACVYNYKTIGLNEEDITQYKTCLNF
ncbi:MAG: radical SAM protein [bacterium]